MHSLPQLPPHFQSHEHVDIATTALPVNWGMCCLPICGLEMRFSPWCPIQVWFSLSRESRKAYFFLHPLGKEQPFLTTRGNDDAPPKTGHTEFNVPGNKG